MSIRIMSAVWQTPCDSGTEKLVFLALADNANDAGICWPSVQTIARKSDITPRSVITAIQALEKKGLLSVRRAIGRSNGYTLKPVKELHQCNSFTSEGASHPPVKELHRGSEGASHPPVKELHTNRHITINEPSDEPPSRGREGETVKPPKAKKPKPDYTAEFESFWQAYPKKKAKEDAAKAFASARSKTDLQTMLAAIAAQRLSQDWQKDGGQYIPFPSTWLRAGRWADETTSINFADIMAKKENGAPALEADGNWWVGKGPFRKIMPANRGPEDYEADGSLLPSPYLAENMRRREALAKRQQSA